MGEEPPPSAPHGAAVLITRLSRRGHRRNAEDGSPRPTWGLVFEDDVELEDNFRDQVAEVKE